MCLHGGEPLYSSTGGLSIYWYLKSRVRTEVDYNADNLSFFFKSLTFESCCERATNVVTFGSQGVKSNPKMAARKRFPVQWCVRDPFPTRIASIVF